MQWTPTSQMGPPSCNLRIVDPRAGGGRGIQELGEENLESV